MLNICFREVNSNEIKSFRSKCKAMPPISTSEIKYGIVF